MPHRTKHSTPLEPRTQTLAQHLAAISAMWGQVYVMSAMAGRYQGLYQVPKKFLIVQVSCVNGVSREGDGKKYLLVEVIYVQHNNLQRP